MRLVSARPHARSWRLAGLLSSDGDAPAAAIPRASLQARPRELSDTRKRGNAMTAFGDPDLRACRATGLSRPSRSGGAGTNQGPRGRRTPGPTNVPCRRAPRRRRRSKRLAPAGSPAMTSGVADPSSSLPPRSLLPHSTSDRPSLIPIVEAVTRQRPSALLLMPGEAIVPTRTAFMLRRPSRRTRRRSRLARWLSGKPAVRGAPATGDIDLVAVEGGAAAGTPLSGPGDGDLVVVELKQVVRRRD